MANEKHRKRWTTVLKDIWYNALCGWLVGMAVIGHWFIGLLVVFFVTDGNATNWWCLTALALASIMLTFGILRYLGRGARRKDNERKLIEFIRKADKEDYESRTQDDHYVYMADHLIANGVTIQKWIPVSEMLPDNDGTYIVRTKTGSVTTARFYVGKIYPPTHYRPEEYHSPTKWQSNRNVTHWMPLPSTEGLK